MNLKTLLPAAWYSDQFWVKLLLPLSMLYGWAMRKRRSSLEKVAYQATVPVIVIGNITAGGTGKTPLTMMLARALQDAGYKPVIVSRGYGGKSTRYPLLVDAETATDECGDEALLMSRNSDCPVIVDPVRSRAVLYAETRFEPDVILSDDGLQHYALARKVEIAVIDGSRGLGNGLLLPAGPLREPAVRLDSVDCVVINGNPAAELPVFNTPRFTMLLEVTGIRSLKHNVRLSREEWLQQQKLQHNHEPPHNRVHAVAGIGNPGRFFASLQELGFDTIEHPFQDHYEFRAGELDFEDALPVLMTEKDAVKYQPFAGERHWALQVEARLPESFCHTVIQLLSA